MRTGTWRLAIGKQNIILDPDTPGERVVSVGLGEPPTGTDVGLRIHYNTGVYTEQDGGALVCCAAPGDVIWSYTPQEVPRRGRRTAPVAPESAEQGEEPVTLQEDAPEGCVAEEA